MPGDERSGDGEGEGTCGIDGLAPQLPAARLLGGGLFRAVTGGAGARNRIGINDTRHRQLLAYETRRKRMRHVAASLEQLNRRASAEALQPASSLQPLSTSGSARNS